MERRLPFKSTLGALLPLCLLWGFIACVLLCLHHGEESHDAVAVEMIDNDCGADGCPVTDDTEFVAPSRPTNVPHAGEGWHACPAAPRAPEGTYASAPTAKIETTTTPPANAPPEKLCVLRI